MKRILVRTTRPLITSQVPRNTDNFQLEVLQVKHQHQRHSKQASGPVFDRCCLGDAGIQSNNVNVGQQENVIFAFYAPSSYSTSGLVSQKYA